MVAVSPVYTHLGAYRAQTVENGERAIVKKVVIAGTHLLIGRAFVWRSKVGVVPDLDEKNGPPVLVHDYKENHKIDCFRRIISRRGLRSNKVVESVKTIVK